MGREEAERFVLRVLENAGEPLTTREIEEVEGRGGAKCPDAAPVFLNTMRAKGLIQGKVSKEKMGWVWWVEK